MDMNNENLLLEKTLLETALRKKIYDDIKQDWTDCPWLYPDYTCLEVFEKLIKIEIDLYIKNILNIKE